MENPVATAIRITRRRDIRSHRGIAMLLVLVAVAVAVILSMSLLSSQSTNTGIANNAHNHSHARLIAESGLELAISEIKRTGNWRTVYTNGVWIANHAHDGGTFTIVGEDGEYLGSDVSVTGDGDLANDAGHKVTLTVTGNYKGVTHRVRALLTPGQVAMGPINVLMVTQNSGSLTTDEQTRKDLIESWGWTVYTIAAASSQDDYDAAMEGMHVIYAPDDGGSSTVGTRLASATLGVVWEDGDMNDEMKVASSHTPYTGNTINIVDNTHYITSPFTFGGLEIGTTSRRVEAAGGSVVGALRPLAWWPGTEARVVAVVNAGQTLIGGGSAAGRRVVSPFAGFAADELTDDGKMLLKRMLEWSAQAAMADDTVEPLGNWTTSTQFNIPAGEDRLLVVAVAGETHKSLTSLTYGYQPLTLAIAGYESTGVGARNYIYYLREVSIAAATDNRLRATWSSSLQGEETQQFASRAYQNVSQSNPIRMTDANTNAGPVTISSNPLTVSKGDLVFASAMVGQPRSYSWSDPLDEGTDATAGGTVAHSAADFPVSTDLGTVTATATTTSPNRQALVSAVIQPRAQSSGEGVIPQMLVLYDFDQSDPTPALVGHWTLDDNGTGGAIAINDDVDVIGSSALIDGYRGQQGAYSSSNRYQPVILVTNTSDNGSIAVSSSSKIYGSTYNYPGANPTNVVNLSGSGSITGNRYELSVAFSLPSMPSMPSSSGFSSSNSSSLPSSITSNNMRYTKSPGVSQSGTTTISRNVRVENNLTISGTVKIDGDVQIRVDGDLEIENNGTIQLEDASSRLRLYVGGTLTMTGSNNNHAPTINPDTTAASRVQVYVLNNDEDLEMYKKAVVSGSVYVGRDLKMYDSAAIFGAVYVGDDLTMNGSSAIHVDLDMPGYHIVPVADAIGTNPALAHGGVTFDQAGATAGTNKALSFDGSDDFVLIPHHDDYLLHHSTISFWFRSESLSGQRGLFSKDSTGYDTGGQLHIYTDGNSLKARIQSNGSPPFGTGDEFTATSSGLSTNTWYHVTVTIGAGGLRLYRNGTLVDSESYPGGLGASSGGIGNYEPLVLGAGTGSSGDLNHLPLNSYFQGRIDDVRIHREILDATQVSRLYQGQAIGDRTEASYVVRDTSGLGTALDMFIDNTAAVSWSGDGLTISQGTVIRSPEPPSKIRNGVTATGQFTVEIIATPSQADAMSRRLFWYGPNSGSNTNLDIRQASQRHIARVRSSTTSDSPSDVEGDMDIQAGTSHHLLVTFDGDTVRIYRDGFLDAQVQQAGNLLSWDSSYGFTLAGLPQGGSSWLGTLQRVVVYDRAMNQRQVENLVNGMPPGDGASTGVGGLTVRWTEGY